MTQEFNVVLVRERILTGINFLASDIKIFIVVVVFLLVFAWIIMKPALNMDDKAWDMISLFLIVTILFLILVMAGNGTLSLETIKELVQM